MADFTYTKAMAKPIDFQNDDIRVLIVMSNTSAMDDEDAEFIADIGTLDEYNGSSYARVALTTQVWSAVTATDHGKFTSDSIVFPTLGVGTRAGFGLVFYKHIGADSANIPIFYKTPSGWPFTGNGQDITVNPHTDGWAYLRNGSL